MVGTITHGDGSSVARARHRPRLTWTTKVYTGEGQGAAWVDTKESLATVIAEMNDRYGLDLDDRDRLEGEKLKLTLLDDEELGIMARENTMEHYALEFANKWKLAILDQEERNQRLYNLLLSKPELAKMFEKVLMKETYQAFRHTVE